jgi:Ca2+-binding EF-hand superfamily protein
MVQDDRERFQRADINKDSVLDPDEYAAFLHPLDYPHMQDYELDRLIADYDKNHDNYVNFIEYLGDGK